MSERVTGDGPILLVSEGISYCHVVRPLIIGRWLRSLGRPILAACPKHHEPVFRDEGFETTAIETADPREIYQRLAKGKTLYSVDELAEYFLQDARLLDEVLPSLVVADFRFPLQQLATARGIPLVGITSASCHPSFPLNGTTPNPFLTPSFIPASWIDGAQKTPIGLVTRKLLLRDLAAPYRRASKQAGMPVLPSFFDYASQGDICLLSDHPSVMPLPGLRPQDVYTGPLIWEREEPLPQELTRLPNGRPKIYITVGTQESMSLEFLDELLPRLVKAGFLVILSKGKRQFDVALEDENLLVFDFLNETKLLPMLDLYITHGSAMSVYHGLYYGVPMISIPVQADQHFHSEALVRCGVGKLFRPRELRLDQLVDAAKKLLVDEPIQKASTRLSDELRAGVRRDEVVERVSQLVCVVEPA